MRENLKLKHVVDFKHTISEITSISIENDYIINGKDIEGTFLVEGTYKTHGLSLNQEQINLEIPYSYEIEESIDKDTVKVNIIDFTYSIEASSIEIEIEYTVEGEEEKTINDFDDIEEFDRFLKSHEVDIVDLSDDFKEEVKCEEEQILDTLEEEPTLNNEERTVENTILENVSQSEDSYITYHVYICDETDTIESISSKYNISIDTLRNYNDSLEISCGAKLIIPCEDE